MRSCWPRQRGGGANDEELLVAGEEGGCSWPSTSNCGVKFTNWFSVGIVLLLKLLISGEQQPPTVKWIPIVHNSIDCGDSEDQLWVFSIYFGIMFHNIWWLSLSELIIYHSSCIGHVFWGRGHQCLSSLLCYNYTRVIQILQLWLSSCKIRQQEEMRSIKHRTRS